MTLLQQRLQSENYDYKVINASLSGETTTGGKGRIAGALAQSKPDIVILELGGNDGLRGAKIETMQANLTGMVTASKKSGAKVLIVGMMLPPNYGNDYVTKFRTTFASVAKAQHTALTPFIFQGFAQDANAFQPDGIHPTVAMQPRMLDTIWTELKPLLGKPR